MNKAVEVFRRTARSEKCGARAEERIPCLNLRAMERPNVRILGCVRSSGDEGRMSESGAYGRRLADRLHSESSRALVSRTVRNGVVGCTEVRSDHPTYAVSDPIPREDAFLIALQLRDFPDHKYWEDGHQFSVFNLRAGWTTLYDLRRDPRFLLDKPFHSVHFYFPRKFLNAIAEVANAGHLDGLRYEPGNGLDDPIVRALTSLLYPALDRPDQVSRLFVDCIMFALGCHTVQTYGGLETVPTRSGLAPWQERRAKEIIEANLDGEVPLTQLAQECGLSTGHFSRAFKVTMGIPPHQWLLRRRIENAMRLLHNQRQSLPEVALACGFSDQSHFTRVFTKFSGTSPGAWRRLHHE
jgi:AraC family transcriptional regulator